MGCTKKPKREFLEALGLGALGLCSSRLGLGGDAPRTRPRARPKNWIWITTRPELSVDAWKRQFAQLRASGIDAIVPELYDGRHAYWPSTRLPVKTDRLGLLQPLAKAEGLEVHAWMWTLPCLLEDVLKKHPDWYSVNAKGESAADKPAYVDYYRFLDPARPEVRDFIRATVEELASIAELTGVHLDYVRHPDAILPKGLWSRYNLVQDRVYPPYDYGYSAYSRAEFQRTHGVDPIGIADPTHHKEWMQYRLDSVTDLVNGWLVPAAHAAGKQITAAVFPGPTLAREMVRQDWGRWDLDGFLPMLYHNFYEAGPEWVTAQTREGVSSVRKPVYSGLFAFALDAPGLARVVRAALDGGAGGVSVFASDAMDEAKWKAFKEASSSG